MAKKKASVEQIIHAPLPGIWVRLPDREMAVRRIFIIAKIRDLSSGFV